MALLDTIWHRVLRRPYRLAHADIGKGRPVVLLHGLAASKEIWSPMAEELAGNGWRVIAPDLMGFGDSPKPQWSKYTVRDHARMVAAFLKQSGVNKQPAIVVGHSMGCLVAVQLATAYPALVKRLVLYEPPILGELPDFPGHTKRSARYKALFEYVASHPQLAHVENRFLWRVARKLSGLHLSPEEWLPFEQSLRNTIINQQAYDQLKILTVPADIIYGRLDFVVIRQGVKKLFSQNKSVHLHLVTDMHGISKRSARYLAALVKSRPGRRRRSRKTKRASGEALQQKQSN